MTPSKFLPSHSSFESIRKQAKKLVRQMAVSDPDAVARVHAQLPAPIVPTVNAICRREAVGA